MATTLVRKLQLQIRADDGDTETKLDRIQSKADELARDHPELAVRINTAAAAAKLGVLRKELKDTQNQSDKSSFSFRNLGQAVNNATVGLPTGIGEMTMFQKVIAGLNLATGLAEPLLAGATVGIMGLASGLVSAGAGAGIFGLVAKEEFSAVSTNITSATAALNTMGTATTLKEQTADAKAFNAALKGLSGPQRELVTGVANAESGWHFFIKDAADGVDRTLAPALREVPLALHDASEFLGPVESGLSRIISMFNKGFAGSTQQGFIKELAADSGPDLEKTAIAIGHVTTGIEGILKAFLPMSGSVLGGLDRITAKFSSWGQTLTSHNGFQSLMTMFKDDTPIVMKLLSNLGSILRIVISQMTGMDTAANSKTLIQLAATVSGLVNSLLKAHPQLIWLILYFKLGFDSAKKLGAGISTVKGAIDSLQSARKGLSDFTAGFNDANKAADEATGSWGTYGGKVSSVLNGLKSMAVQAAQKLGLMKTATEGVTEATEGEAGAQEALDGAMDANPIGLIILAIAGLVIGFAELWKHSAAFRDFWKTTWADISKTAVAAWHMLDDDVLHPIESAIDGTISFIRRHWTAVLVGVLTGPFGLIGLYIDEHWRQIESGAASMVSRVIGFIESLPGKIVHALGDLGSLMFNVGEHAISMLANGIISAGGSVLSGAVHWAMSKISDFLPHSPAKTGPLSGGGSPDVAGRKIGQMLAAGMGSSTAAVTSAAARVARAAQLGAASSPAAAAAGAGGGHFTFEWVGGQSDQQFMSWIKRNIRIRGGNVDNLGR